MVTSLKRSHACTATFSAPSPATGHRQPTPPPETPGHSQASLGKSPVEPLLLSPGSWCTRFCLCPPRVHFPVLRKFWQLCGGVNGDLLQEGLCYMLYPGLLHPEPLPLQQSTADLYLHRRHSNTILSQSPWGPQALMCTRFVWALWASLVGMGFDSKRHLAGASPLPLDVGYLHMAGPAKHSHCSWPWTWGFSFPISHPTNFPSSSAGDLEQLQWDEYEFAD